MDASPSSLELAARLRPQRASRSASRPPASVTTTTVVLPTTLVTAAALAPTTVVVHKAATAKPTSATTRTTVRHHTTTTKPKPKPTTTTSKPAAKSAPQMRPMTPPAAGESTGQSEVGQATWYEAPEPTMCAHKTIPLGTVITVTNVENGKSTTCRVGDRGPYVEGRILDLSPEGFSQIAALSEGVIDVKITW
jgi:rare lipoprotein A